MVAVPRPHTRTASNTARFLYAAAFSSDRTLCSTYLHLVPVRMRINLRLTDAPPSPRVFIIDAHERTPPATHSSAMQKWSRPSGSRQQQRTFYGKNRTDRAEKNSRRASEFTTIAAAGAAASDKRHTRVALVTSCMLHLVCRRCSVLGRLIHVRAAASSGSGQISFVATPIRVLI